jgi:hypothetical protein
MLRAGSRPSAYVFRTTRRKLQVTTGSDRNHELEFAQPVDDDAQKGALFRHYVFRIAAETTTSVLRWVGIPDWNSNRSSSFAFCFIASTAMAGCLIAFRRYPPARSLNRITEYIRANWSQQLDTEIVAEVGGISGP